MFLREITIQILMTKIAISDICSLSSYQKRALPMLPKQCKLSLPVESRIIAERAQNEERKLMCMYPIRVEDPFLFIFSHAHELRYLVS